MKVAYGYRRAEKDFAEHGVDRVWLDTPKTDRQERAAMLRMGLREGDTLVLLTRADIGPPAAKRIEDIEARGVTVKIVSDDKPKAPGRRPKFEPTPAQDTELRKLWHDPVHVEMRYVIRRATEMAGQPVARHQLIQRYGKRWRT